MLELLRGKRILVVAAHPDDELLGLGATIHRLTSEFQCNARALILGEGITSRGLLRDTDDWTRELVIHKANMKKATEIVGYNSFAALDFPDNRFDSCDILDVIKTIEREIETFQPQIVFTHHGGDTNIDHQITSEAVTVATRPYPSQLVKTVISFETPSSTEWQAFNYKNYFKPNVFIQVFERDMEAKVKGMESYVYERRPFPHPRAPQSLMTYAQAHGCRVGYPLAEAFMLIRAS